MSMFDRDPEFAYGGEPIDSEMLDQVRWDYIGSEGMKLWLRRLLMTVANLDDARFFISVWNELRQYYDLS